MNQYNVPINSIVTCLYTSSDIRDAGKPSYQIIARVTKPNQQWQILQGGWNHTCSTEGSGSLYGIPNTTDKDYSNFQVYTDQTTFPNPELFI